jgi:ubiquitin-protein ligase
LFSGDPLMGEIAEEYENNREKFVRKAKEFTKKFAIEKDE